MATGGGRDPKRQKQSAPLDGGGVANEVSGSGGPATATNLTVADTDADALNCGVCFLPLKAPIFQVNLYTP